MMSKNEKIPGCGFHHVALRANDFAATVAFYTEGLGFVRRHGWGEGAKEVALLDTGDGNYMEIFAGVRVKFCRAARIFISPFAQAM
ncbi:VOC family protein [Brevibacillus fluminis]|uniref:VOC family protein n=1 Tax=Brevibacillus fluminis TaxID=511487 RepID=UPI003F89E52D